MAASLVLFLARWNRPRDAPRVDVKMTSSWKLAELGTPIIVARDVFDAEVPPGSTILAAGTVAPEVLASCKVRQVPAVRSEFAMDPAGTRALVFTAGVADGTLAMWTTDEAILHRLQAELRMLQARAGHYVERLPVAALAGKSGVDVETQGLVQDIIQYRGRFMIRLEDQGAIIGVVVGKDPEPLRDERILVQGRLEHDESGYAVIKATEIRRIR